MGTGQICPKRGFTVLELCTVVAIIAILAVLVLGAAGAMRSRARREQCMANLKSLYLGTELYLQQNNEWPQIQVKDDEQAFAQAWIAALQPFDVPLKTWICPEIQQLLGNPDYLQPENARIDYFPMPFDNKPLTPHEWPTQPWFIERGNLHGKGCLIIFTDGSIVGSDEIFTAR